MSHEYKRKSFVNVKKDGICWDLIPSIIKKFKHSLKDCWKDFHRLPVFNWYPEAMIDKEWRPICPHCGKKCLKNGNSAYPRLVFGQWQNYWLNAPARYFCRSCSDSQHHLTKEEK